VSGVRCWLQAPAEVAISVTPSAKARRMVTRWLFVFALGRFAKPGVDGFEVCSHVASYRRKPIFLARKRCDPRARVWVRKDLDEASVVGEQLGVDLPVIDFFEGFFELGKQGSLFLLGSKDCAFARSAIVTLSDRS